MPQALRWKEKTMQKQCHRPLREEDRKIIYPMRKAGKTQQEIAEALGVHCARKNENQMQTTTGIMSQKSKAEYLESCRARHPDRNRAGKSAMIGEVSDTLRWDRKHAIKALNRKVSSPTCSVVDKSVVVGIWKRSKQP